MGNGTVDLAHVAWALGKQLTTYPSLRVVRNYEYNFAG